MVNWRRKVTEIFYNTVPAMTSREWRKQGQPLYE
jgi:hypothetical protein